MLRVGDKSFQVIVMNAWCELVLGLETMALSDMLRAMTFGFSRGFGGDRREGHEQPTTREAV